MKPVTAYLSLGSNVGDRDSNLAQATMALSINFNISDIESSTYYETEPLYKLDQPPFLNAVVKCSTTLKPFDLLDVTKQIEKMLGRSEKREKNSPRIIDIDILFHGDAFIETDELMIPHPMLGMRKFVLIPFAELAPDFKIPHSKITINDLLDHCIDTSTVTRHPIETQA
ncbi:MAG: 2-amino-4-hydroxy-6-hydroxymethyldihydropteridine diphosphokinase [Candidatus Marinimicrobia bacterium]|jgi:2-amino-4-hydroxy-6-hydroxymethyldihydropteridine diphosphokinase|nr:2-amino-4-hydroxy-6-hydroxymethyldihydropteridine diphosphokinase [Candidatus Neomarinimicrobiota bacterium]MBT3945099.1 2-amino-4-hydroxy-6-hydroxymethyldihydropteridine diphosphokinase [Candidatus Neomarinimicrobiota bacterium]MBT4154920.1 2-amino-4-hydroxy-6-hydroxymethyldihydropteridine diphosphokinase [Candidatus Neomarinimicrobiota bacterium]MBT4555147.1 2-amino-4-hydroxy-6-hydroxymethyldihydropteridine diphosphokinase [Candidatus Neomarinimicrobiota bacterium]MBT4752233.1 2-amino-4-hy